MILAHIPGNGESPNPKSRHGRSVVIAARLLALAMGLAGDECMGAETDAESTREAFTKNRGHHL
jgi:hypothetical protein